VGGEGAGRTRGTTAGMRGRRAGQAQTSHRARHAVGRRRCSAAFRGRGDSRPEGARVLRDRPRGRISRLVTRDAPGRRRRSDASGGGEEAARDRGASRRCAAAVCHVALRQGPRYAEGADGPSAARRSVCTRARAASRRLRADWGSGSRGGRNGRARPRHSGRLQPIGRDMPANRQRPSSFGGGGAVDRAVRVLARCQGWAMPCATKCRADAIGARLTTRR